MNEVNRIILRRIGPLIHRALITNKIIFLAMMSIPAHSLDLGQFIQDSLTKGNKTIVVPEGEYTLSETIRLGVEYSGKRLVAENENVRIRSSQMEPVFSISNVTNFELSGFNFLSVDLDNPESPIGFHYRGGIEEWTNGSVAIRVVDSSRITLSKNYISGYWAGIYITVDKTFTSYVEVVENVVSNCGYWSIAARDMGLPPSTDTKKRLQHITFRKNSISKSEQGPIFRNVSYGDMDQNKVFENLIGIRIELTHFSVLRNNEVSKNLQSGIWVYHHSYYNHIVNNTIFDNNLQALRIKKIAKMRNLDENFLPGNIERFDRHPKHLFAEYEVLQGRLNDTLAYEPEYWPYPTAYDIITPSIRVNNHLDPELNAKFWGIYFSQWGAYGVELRSDASYNLIENNNIFNTAPVSLSSGYMVYGIKIAHILETTMYDSRFNFIRNNNIENMIEGPILNVNASHGLKRGNIFE